MSNITSEEGPIGLTSPSRRVTIGVSSSEFREAARERVVPRGDPPREDFVISVEYLRAILLSGAIPFVIPPIMPGAIGQILDNVDALFVSGGPDIDPAIYNKAPSEYVGPTNLMTDTFQTGLIREADIRQMPILTVCRGTQLMNVSRGGSLHQHIPEDFPESTINHAQEEGGAFATHDVKILEGSKIHRALERTETHVNSFHHQCCDRLGSNIEAIAWAPDGVIEGIQATDRDFMLGVQWHSESQTRQEDQQERLFRGLAEAAERRMATLEAVS
ncbi:MAG: gamma-glutamyl-gamma-aminobutyrate hydrolase family protein [Thermoleophilaceae bacterium]|nr:gamma-glutamyl-gamma-aminobutyrate hydrolase family protein [Thermoleophilaceae bacterium]